MDKVIVEQQIFEFSSEDDREQHPEQTDSIVMGVRECTEGRYEADFRLALCGVSNLSQEARRKEELNRVTPPDNNLRALLTSLSDHQVLDFSYEWQHEPGISPRFDWKIAGTCNGNAGTSALEGARDLFHSLQVVLGNPELGFRFSSDKPNYKKSVTDSRWIYSLEPAAISIPLTKRRPIGYTGAQPSDRKVVLTYPMERNEVNFDSVISVGSASPATFTVSLQLEARTLTEEDLDIVRMAFEQLRTGEVGQIRHEGAETSCIYDESIVGSTLSRLERWLGEPRGYKARCIVEADRPLPQSLLEIIGRELFQGVPVSTCRVSEVSDVAHRNGLTDVNLAGCFHLSDSPLNLLLSTESLQNIGVPRVYTSSPRGLSTKGLVLGNCEQQHVMSPVRIADSDRSRHCYVTGATGTGKSTLLNNMIIQDVEHGEGLCVIDPHGDLYEQVLESIPEHRASDVILMDLSDLRYSVGLNFLECNGPNKDLQMNYITNEMMSIFHRLYNMDIAGGPVFESYMRNALLAVMSNENRTATLLDIVRFFEDGKFRSYIKSKCTNPLVKSFWDKQAEKVGGDYALTNMGPYITSKLNQFTHNALLRPIIGQTKTTIDFRKAMDQGKIILVNLAKGLLGDFDAKLLGMLLIGKIFNASLARTSMSQSERRPFYLYIDEFQNLATPTVIGMVSEARKFGLSLIMANQHLGQFSEDDKMRGVVDAILGNVASMLFFRMGPKDAEQLETYTNPYLDAHDIQHLPDHHVACRMLSNNVPLPPFVFKTMPIPATNRDDETQEKITRDIRRRARHVYARKRETVEAGIMQNWSTIRIEGKEE